MSMWPSYICSQLFKESFWLVKVYAKLVTSCGETHFLFWRIFILLNSHWEKCKKKKKQMRQHLLQTLISSSETLHVDQRHSNLGGSFYSWVSHVISLRSHVQRCTESFSGCTTKQASCPMSSYLAWLNTGFQGTADHMFTITHHPPSDVI